MKFYQTILTKSLQILQFTTCSASMIQHCITITVSECVVCSSFSFSQFQFLYFVKAFSTCMEHEYGASYYQKYLSLSHYRKIIKLSFSEPGKPFLSSKSTRQMSDQPCSSQQSDFLISSMKPTQLRKAVF